MPNQKEFGQTRQDWRSASPVYSRKTWISSSGISVKLAAKLPWMQLIVDLLPGGNGQGVLIHIGCVSLMNIVNFNLRRQPGVFRATPRKEMMQNLPERAFSPIVKAGGKPLPAPPTGYGFLRR